jgi:dimethylargininase
MSTSATPQATTTLIALTRDVSDAIARCELTHREREPIDVARAREQHAAYEEALRAVGCTVERMPDAPDFPDAVFVEDTAVVLDEVAVLMRPGAESRRGEVASAEAALAPFREIARIEAPGTMDGGDVLAMGRHVFVGRSLRTNDDGIEQLRAMLYRFGYAVEPVPVYECLHLKSAVTAIDPETLLINRAWTKAESFRAYDLTDVHPFEPFAANALGVGYELIYPAEFPLTLERLERRGFSPRTVPASELAKAEGGVTCCSLIFQRGD